MKKLFIVLFILLFIVGCRNIDSISFKKEYESLNGNNDYIDVNIKSDNPFIYITDSELVEKIENKEDLVVFFGYNKSNDTRFILDSIIEVCNKLKIDKVYYLDILNIRNEIEVNENGEVVTKKEGSKLYTKLLELLEGHIEEYIVNGRDVGTRIYAPNILIIKNKNINDILNPKSYLESDDEKKKDSYNKIYEYLNKYVISTCDVNETC